MEKAWFANAQVNTARGELTHLTLHVRPYTLYQVTANDGRIHRFSSLDVDPERLETIGAEEAQRRAEALRDSLNQIKGLWSKLATELPENQQAKLERLDKLDTVLVAVSSRGGIDVFNGETGQRKWGTAVGWPKYPTTAAGVNDKYVALINGLHLFVFEIESGDLLWKKTVEGVPAAGPALSSRYAFVPMVDGILESHRLDDPGKPVAHYQSLGRALMQPTVSPNTVVWPTDLGYYYVAPADRPGIYYRLETTGRSMSRPAFSRDKLYVASLDGYVYCLTELNGQLSWSRAFGEPLSHQPVVVGDHLYLVGEGGTIWCLNADSGETLWTGEQVDHLLAVAAGKVFVTSLRGTRVRTLDENTGRVVSQLSLTGQLVMPMTNGMTDRIYVADPRGLIQCFRPIGSVEPVAHIEISEQKAAEPAEVEQGPAAPPAQAPAADNPFGGAGGGADNPFGGAGGGADNPFGNPPPSGNPNPFGGGPPPAGKNATNPPAAGNPFGGGGGGNPFDN